MHVHSEGNGKAGPRLQGLVEVVSVEQRWTGVLMCAGDRERDCH